MVNYAVCDIGSNTVRVVIFKRKKNEITEVFSEKRALGLLNYIEQGELLPIGISELVDCLAAFQAIAQVFSCEEFAAFATASLRGVTNAAQVLAEIEQKTGILPEVISGEDEAYYDYIGARLAGLAENALLCDVGGGSCELIAARNGAFGGGCSLPFGSLSLRNRFVAGIVPTVGEIAAMSEFVNKNLRLGSVPPNSGYSCLYGIGGTARLIARYDRNLQKKRKSSHKYAMSAADLQAMYQQCVTGAENVQQAVLKFNAQRVHTAIPGIIVFSELAKISRVDSFVVLKFGVREGYLLAKVLKNEEGEKCRILLPQAVL